MSSIRLLRERYLSDGAELVISTPETLAIEYCLRAAGVAFEIIDVASVSSSLGPLPVLRQCRKQITGIDAWFEAMSQVNQSSNQSLFLDPSSDQMIAMRGLLDRVQLVFHWIWRSMWLCFPGVESVNKSVRMFNSL